MIICIVRVCYKNVIYDKDEETIRSYEINDNIYCEYITKTVLGRTRIYRHVIANNNVKNESRMNTNNNLIKP